MNALTTDIEKILQRLAAGKRGAKPEQLLDATAGDVEQLANALWTLVREGKGGLVGHDRNVVATLGLGTFDAQDFLSLLRQFKSANLMWFEHWTERDDGLAYHGWSKELEAILDKLLETTTDRTVLEWADVSEPAGSSLLFALGRRGMVDAAALPPDVLPRFGRAFLQYRAWCAEQFGGWERLWNEATFARAAFASLDEIEAIGVFPAELAPLVPHASNTQLAVLIEKMIFADKSVVDWLVTRGKAILPQLEVRLDELLRDIKRNEWRADNLGWHMGALARIRTQRGDSWPAAWTPLAEAMLQDNAPGLLDVLWHMDAATRERLLLKFSEQAEYGSKKLWPLAEFPTPRLVERLVELIHETPAPNEVQFDARDPYYKILGQMGPLGQTALESLMGEPEHMAHAMAQMKSTKTNLSKTLAALKSSSFEIKQPAEQLWFNVSHDERLDLVEQHFADLPVEFIARLLGHSHFLLRAAELAKRLPDTDETRVWRNLCLHPPEALRPLMEEIANTSQEAIERAKKALAPEFAAQNEGTKETTRLDARLAALGTDDLAAVVLLTAGRVVGRQDVMWFLCRHFWPARPETPWVAAFWWSMDRGSMLDVAAKVMGEAFIPALDARAASGTLSRHDWYDVLPIFTRLDPITGFGYFTRFADQSWMRLYVQAGVLAALEKGSEEARTWLVQALAVNKTREFALHVLQHHALPEAAAALEALRNQKLPAKLKKLLPVAVDAQATQGSMLVRSGKTLSARVLHKVDGPIESLRVSPNGETMVALAAKKVTVWYDQQEATLDHPTPTSVDVSLDGRFVLWLVRHGVKVFEHRKSVNEFCSRLGVGIDMVKVVPMPGGRLCLLGADAVTHGGLTMWDMETGQHQTHPVKGSPVQAAWIDEQRYVLATKDEKITIRQMDGGTVTGKLQSWENYHGGGICALASGNAGKLVAVVFADGSLMIWDISGARVKALGRHSRVAPLALVADPGSSWVVTPGTKEVLTWKDGQPARSLVGSGARKVRRGEHSEDVGMAVFVRPNVVAVGGRSVDIWDLGTNQHLGHWDKPVTTMIAAQGRLMVADIEGNIWEVDGG